MSKRSAVIAVLIGFVCVVFGASCQTALPPMPTSTTSPVPSPTILILTNTPTSLPAITPTRTRALPSCPWIAYLNGKPTHPLSDENCLNDLSDIGVSGDARRISFFVDGVPTGTYGVCRDVSKKDKLEFHVAVRDNIASARFLVTIGPSSIPVKTSSRGFRIQPEVQGHQEEMYVKFIEYVSKLDGYDTTIDKIQASLDWKHVDNWIFDFVFQSSGSKVNVSMNQALFEHWQLNSPNRYLCFVYQAMPTGTQATELEAQVNFP